GRGMGELVKQAKGYLSYQMNKPSGSEIAIQRLEERLADGDLELRVRSLEGDRALKTLNLALKTLIYTCLTGFSALVGAVLLVGGYQGGAIAAGVVAIVMAMVLGKSLLKLTVREKLDRLGR
ncbi:MAG: AarF/ABC1/UbiB kinase family protein, partial [Synechococcales bacterium]|nr:AarF/ABC1/UbiB kinase family protein [Synechococcales bacterium]